MLCYRLSLLLFIVGVLIMFEYYFEGRCPSFKQVINKVREGLRLGYRKFEISWGENMIELELFNGELYGHGWIRRFGGDDVAKEINKTKIGV